MSYLKKISLFLGSFWYLLMGHAVIAANLGGLNDTAGAIGYKTSQGNARAEIAAYIGMIIGSVIAFVGVVFMVLIFSGAFDIITAGGNDDSVAKGRDKIKNGAIGILIIFSAYILTVFVLRIVSGGLIGMNLFNIGL